MDAGKDNINSIWLSPNILYEFIDELREAGYNIGIGQYIAAQDLILALAAQGDTLDSLEQLRTLLGPIVCSSVTEQEDFQQRFSQWVHSISSARLESDKEDENIEALSKELETIRWHSNRLGRILAVASLALIGIFVPVIVWQPKEPPDINPSIETITPTQPPEEAIQPSEETTQPSEETTQPSEETTQPPEEATQPSEEATQPSEEATQPSEETTQPSDKPIVTDFLDIPENHWAKDSITELVDRNIIGGYPDGTFRPESFVTRAEIATLFDKAFELKTNQINNDFRDVVQDYWAYEAISNVVNSDFMRGYCDDTFRPNVLITRAELIASIVNGLDLNYKESESNPLEECLEREEISNSVSEAINAAKQEGIFIDDPNSLELRATRADVSTLLIQALNYREKLDIVQDQALKFDWYLASMFCLLTLCITFLIWRLWWIWKARLFLQRHSMRGQPELHNISIRHFEQDLFPAGPFIHTAQSLRCRVRIPSNQLDLNKTIDSTIRQGGWLTPIYRDRQVLPEYLFLIDRTSYGDHQAKFMEEMIDRLKHNAVFITTYFFDESPSICFVSDGTGASQTLDEIAAKYSHHRLIINVDADKLFSPATGQLQPWVNQMMVWGERVVLTPKPIKNWGYHELELVQQFIVLPATPRGMRVLSQVFHYGQATYTLSDETQSLIPKVLRTRPYHWIDRNIVQSEQVDIMLVALKEYLGKAGFYLLSACAIFPELHWNITIYLGNVLKAIQGKSLFEVCSVNDIARLPWFRHGYMPDWLRERLISELTWDQEHAVRSALQQLLVTAVQGATNGLQLHIGQQNHRFLQSLTNPLLFLLSRRVTEDSPVRDYMFLSFMVKQPKLAIKATDNLNQLIQTQTDIFNGLAQKLKGHRWFIGIGTVGITTLFVGIAYMLQPPPSPLPPTAPPVPSSTTDSPLATEQTDFLIPTDPPLTAEQDDLLELTISANTAPSSAIDSSITDNHEPPLLRRIRGVSNGNVRSIAISPDGQNIISGSDSGEIQLRELNTGNLVSTLGVFPEWVHAVAFSPDGRLIIGGSVGGYIALWNLKESAVSTFAASAGVYSLAFSPDGEIFVSGHGNGSIGIWDTSGELVRSIDNAHTGSITSIAFSPSNTNFASRSAGSDNQVRFWDIEGNPLAIFDAGSSGGVNSIAISRDGSLLAAYITSRGERIAVGFPGPESIGVWSLDTEEVIANLNMESFSRPHALAFSPDGQYLAVGGFSNKIEIWNISTFERVQTLNSANQIYSLAYSPDGTTLVSSGSNGIIEIWSVN